MDEIFSIGFNFSHQTSNKIKLESERKGQDTTD